MVKKFFPNVINFILYRQNVIKNAFEEELLTYDPAYPILILLLNKFKINNQQIEISSDNLVLKQVSADYKIANLLPKGSYNSLYAYESTLYATQTMVLDKNYNLMMTIVMADDSLSKGTIFVHNSLFNSTDMYKKKLLKEITELIALNFNTTLYITGFSSYIKLFKKNKIKPIYNMKEYIINFIKS